MSKFMYTANGSAVSNKQRIIEGMADATPSQKLPSDFFNLAGNLKLAGSVRATNFYKEDGTELNAVNKLALPENVYYVDKKLGINQDKPMADLDVKGRARVLGELGVDGSMGVSGNLVGRGTSTFGGKVIAEDDLAVMKNGGFGGYLNVGGNLNTLGTSTFKGPVTAEDTLVVNKNAGIRGNMGVGGQFGVQGTSTFKGRVLAEDELIVNKAGSFGSINSKGLVTAEDVTVSRHLNASGNANISGDIAFNGANKWIVHTPDDNRRIMYIAPGNDKGEWMWDKQTQFLNNGNVQLSGALTLGGQEIPHPDNVDGALYRADGQVQVATDDLIRLRHVGSKQTGIQFDVRPGAGDMQNPNGQMKISRQGIMFGGPNEGREVNSAQITAGLHEANSLNIVGMSDVNKANRRVDMWAEGGFKVNGPTNINGVTNVSGDIIGNSGRLTLQNNGDWKDINLQGKCGQWHMSGPRCTENADFGIWYNPEPWSGKWQEQIRLSAKDGKFKVPATSQICIGNTCVTEAALKQLVATQNTSSNKLSDYMYFPEDAVIYQNVFDALQNSAIAKSGNPVGWDEGSYKVNPWNGRQLLRIGFKNAFPNGLLVNVPDGKSVIWISVLSDRWESFEVYNQADGKPLGNFTSGYRLSNRINPDGTNYVGNLTTHTWMPIPVPGPGKYVICGGNKKNDGGNDCWISGIAFSSNPWAHAMNSAVAYHWLVNDGSPNPTWVNHNERGDHHTRLDRGKTYVLNVPVVKSSKDKLLYFVLNDSFTDCKIAVNDKPVDKLVRTNNNPFAKFFNNATFDGQYFNNFVATKVPNDYIQASGFLKVTVDLTGLSNDINFREIGTIDIA